MPELPEVETVRRDLANHLIGNRFQAIKVINFKNVAPTATFLAKFLKSKKIEDVRRRGKLLIIDLENNDYHLLFHLKMTGQLIFTNENRIIGGGHSLANQLSIEAVGGTLPNKHTRAYFRFDNNSYLFFNDLRKFGYIKLASQEELVQILRNNYGPEPMDREFNFAYLRDILKNRRRPIKALILDQKLIAGLGNIYADEALFRAGIMPAKNGGTLAKVEIERLLVAIKEVIVKAIKYRGTTFNNYVDGEGKQGNYSAFLQVYGRKGQNCFKCQRKILKIKLAGRGTHYCAYCQK